MIGSRCLSCPGYSSRTVTCSKESTKWTSSKNSPLTAQCISVSILTHHFPVFISLIGCLTKSEYLSHAKKNGIFMCLRSLFHWIHQWPVISDLLIYNISFVCIHMDTRKMSKICPCFLRSKHPEANFLFCIPVIIRANHRPVVLAGFAFIICPIVYDTYLC